MIGAAEIIGLLIAAVVAFFLLEMSIRRSTVGALLVLIATAFSITFPYIIRPSVGGTQIDHWDVVSVLLVSAAVARLLRTRNISSIQWLLIAFSLVALLSVAQGVPEYGLNTAVNEFRKYFWFVSVTLYFCTIQPDRTLLDVIGRGWLVLAGFLVLLSLMRWGAQPLGLSGAFFGALRPEEDMRVILASATLILLQGFLIAAVAWARGEAGVWMRRLAPALLGAVVLMQHRTVWAVGLVAVGVMVLLERRIASKLIPIAVLAVITIAGFSLTVLDDRGEDLSTQLAESAAYRVTWEWRVEGWYLLIAGGPQGATEIMAGQPFGGGWERWLHGAVVNYSPHNFYVETYLRTGLLGLTTLVMLYAMAFKRLGTGRGTGGLLGRRTMFLLLLTHPVYFVPYAPSPEQGIILGLALATAMGLPAAVRSRAAEAPMPVVQL